jgi:hypothetical protein
MCNEAGHILPAGNPDKPEDLWIFGGVSCVVDGTVPGGNYVYRNVNIWGGGSLTFEDTTINFHAHSILIENGGALQAGFDHPLKGPLSIFLYGPKDGSIPWIPCENADESTPCGIPDRIWNSNPGLSNAVMAMNMGSTPAALTNNPGCTTVASVAPPNTPIPAGLDCFYQYEPDPPSAGNKGTTTYFGDKVLGVSYGGSLYLRGAKGILIPPQGTSINQPNPADSGTSWVRLNGTISSSQKGTTSFSVDRPVDWQSGDQIVLTSTDYLPAHSEELTIDTVSPNGTTITVQPPGVQNPHWGEAYDYSGFPESTGPQDDPNRPPTQASRHIENRAAVALLTRSILIESEGDTPVLQGRQTGPNDPHFPTSAGYYGGHTLIRAGVKQYQVQGVEFANLGQGGQIGRYPVHFHMARTVPPATTDPQPFDGTYVVDSSIHDSNTRFITIHATQGVLLARNVGYRSIGHGFYLEDATETNNRLYSNIGIQAVAAVNSAQNTRKTPGILSRTGNSEGEVVPFHSDYDHPSIFWIMNTWNDFQYNVAVGAGTCGVCYWMPPGYISGFSQWESWSSYAGMQRNLGNAGETPFMKFVGNSCSAAMTALQLTSNSAACIGVQSSDAAPVTGKLQAIANPTPLATSSYPNLSGGDRIKATLCDTTTGDCSNAQVAPVCTGDNGGESTCAATIIDHFTTSFNWAQFNFAAILVRGWWYLLSNSAITDVQNGGLQMVTGGGYTRSDVAQGFWNLSSHNLFIGNTQPIPPGIGAVPDNPDASNAGPFTPHGLSCNDAPGVGVVYGSSFCLSAEQGIAFENSNFGNSQRLLHIYDGPTFEDSDAFSDIHALSISTLQQCRPDGNTLSGDCRIGQLNWMNAFISGVLQSPAGNTPGNDCILPNAAISWKQPNGFYYPPAFDSRNLYFDPSVDIRHFVIDPLWEKGGYSPDTTAAQNTYCTWQKTDFNNFNDIDRQTELTDLDGSLTGLLSEASGSTISVNNDPTGNNDFFNAPAVTPECQSNAPNLTATVNTSAYEVLTTAVFPACLMNGSNQCVLNWSMDCGNQSCYGVPLYRQYMTQNEMTKWQSDHTNYPSIRMMGQGNGQRSTMSINHGSYYIDTTVPASMQIQDPVSQLKSNLFQAGQTYWFYFVYAKPSLHQTYSMYIGPGLSEDTAVGLVRTGLMDPSHYTFSPGLGPDATSDWITSKSYDSTSGVLSLTIDLGQQGNVFAKDQVNFCQPTSYCSYTNGSCQCNPNNSECTDNSVCSWGTKEIDCPVAGCFGFSVMMPGPDTFKLGAQPLPPPDPVLFSQGPDSEYFKGVAFTSAPSSVSGAACNYPTPPPVQPSTTFRPPSDLFHLESRTWPK